jgi:starch phosphorylase
MMFRDHQLTVAYFSMEICLEQTIPTYSGGLGVLAGDTLRSAADLGVHMVGVTLAHRRGYFTQRIDATGVQTEAPSDWRPEDRLPSVGKTVTVEIEGRTVHVRAWRYTIRGVGGHDVPVLLLDTAVPENSEYDRHLTDSLYGGDSRYRLCQEVVLGVAGALMVRAIGWGEQTQHHINEGHAALLALPLLERQLAGRAAYDVTASDVQAVARNCVFTTHTPVPAGHDRFPKALAVEVLGAERSALLDAADVWEDDELNMTRLALLFTRYVNGVALRHQQVSQAMFPDASISAVTNGVHAATWTAPAFRALFDRRIPEWRRDNQYLRSAVDIPLDEIREAHAAAKRALLSEVARRSSVTLDPAAFTLAFARRATAYKRADLIFHDIERLRGIARDRGPMQLVFAGKAHPRDEGGKQLIRRVHEAGAALGDDVRVVYLENYEMELGGLLTSGADVWLNNPMRPLEASGTSGMKSALNGVPSLSTVDGWWVEGCIEGVTGWAVGSEEATVDPDATARADAADLYHKLESAVLPLYYAGGDGFARVMRNAIAFNGSFFNTQRMVAQYVQNAYIPGLSLPALAQVLAKA